MNVAEELTHILNLITKLDNENVKDFLKIVLSSIIVRVSNQESDTRFAAKNKKHPITLPLNCFFKSKRIFNTHSRIF